MTQSIPHILFNQAATSPLPKPDNRDFETSLPTENFSEAVCPYCGQYYWLGERCYSSRQAANCPNHKERIGQQQHLKKSSD